MFEIHRTSRAYVCQAFLHLDIAYIWEMMAYAERDGIVPFQANKFDCSDAGMVYWWITGANQGGNNEATPADIKDMLLMPDKLAR